MHDSPKQSVRLPRLESKDDFERICAILCPDEPLGEDEDEFEPPDATQDTLTMYHEFLLPKLPAGLKMTGREDVGSRLPSVGNCVQYHSVNSGFGLGHT